MLEVAQPNRSALAGGLVATKRQCARAALLSVSVLCLGIVVGQVPLPFDREYGAVIYLMWCGSWAWGPVILVVRSVFLLACLLVPLILVLRVVWPTGREPTSLCRTWNTCYRYAVVLPVAYILATGFSRYVANLVYFGASSVSWDFTPYVAAVESPVLELLQRSADSARARAVFAGIYSAGWYLSMATLAPILIATNKPSVVNRLLTAQLLTAIAAVPLFLAFPLFEPWTLNPAYAVAGTMTSHVQYLNPNPNLGELTRIARDARWAAGSCLPSLHVAFPLVAGLVLWQSRLRVIGAVFVALAAITGYTTVFLGRHWIIDVVAAVPYALGIAWAARRLEVRMTLAVTRAPRHSNAPLAWVQE
jgi:membrane-associated phospholipid phosphatase